METTEQFSMRVSKTAFHCLAGQSSRMRENLEAVEVTTEPAMGGNLCLC